MFQKTKGGGGTSPWNLQAFVPSLYSWERGCGDKAMTVRKSYELRIYEIHVAMIWLTHINTHPVLTVFTFNSDLSIVPTNSH